MTSAQSSLDLSRRRVAAISFLANISTRECQSGQAEIRLDCLKNTNVLRDFRRKKRERRLWIQLRREKEKEQEDFLPKISKKLTFKKTESALFVDQEEEEKSLTLDLAKANKNATNSAANSKSAPIFAQYTSSSSAGSHKGFTFNEG